MINMFESNQIEDLDLKLISIVTPKAEIKWPFWVYNENSYVINMLESNQIEDLDLKLMRSDTGGCFGKYTDKPLI